MRRLGRRHVRVGAEDEPSDGVAAHCRLRATDSPGSLGSHASTESCAHIVGRDKHSQSTLGLVTRTRVLGQEGRHSLAAAVFHGRRGELYERYHKGMEDQLGALGLVLNCIVLWNTRYMNAALDQLRAQGHPVLDEDVARLSPFIRHHLNVHGQYSFLLPDLLAGLRALRDPSDDDREVA